MTLVDLSALAIRIHHRIGAPLGYVPGRTRIRNAIVDLLSCSELEAEELVAQLENRGFISYPRSTVAAIDKPVAWNFPRGNA